MRFSLARPTIVSLALFDLAGRRARRIVDGAMLDAGEHEAAISSAGLEPGVYFLRLDVGREATSRQIVVVR